MKVQFYEETKFYNILKFSSERGREGEQNTRLNQERLSTYFRTGYFAQAFFSICMVVEDSCFVPVPTHNIKYRFKFKSKHLGNHGRANVHLIDQ